LEKPGGLWQACLPFVILVVTIILQATQEHHELESHTNACMDHQCGTTTAMANKDVDNQANTSEHNRERK